MKRAAAVDVVQFRKCITSYNRLGVLGDNIKKQKKELDGIQQRYDQWGDEIENRRRQLNKLKQRGTLTQREIDKFNKSISNRSDFHKKGVRGHAKRNKEIKEINLVSARHKKSCDRSYAQDVRKTACGGNNAGYCARSDWSKFGRLLPP